MKIKQEKLLLGHKSGIYGLEAVDDGHFLSAAGDGWIVEWPIQAGEDGNLLLQIEAQIFALSYHKASGQIWAGDMNGGVYISDYREKSLLKKVSHHNKGTYAVEARPEFIFTSGADGVFSLWSPDSLRPEESVQVSRKHLRAVSFHPTRPVMAVAGGDGHIYIFHTTSWQCIQQIEVAHERSIFDLKFHPSGNQLISGGMDAHLKVWNWEEARLEHKVPAHVFTINGLAIDSKGLWLATASRDNSIKIWDLKTIMLEKVIDSTKKNFHMNSVNAIFFHDKSRQWISAGDDRTIRLWSMHNDDQN
jgi:WD40 repeat protein